mgnify:CR=1 FL=1
MTNWCWAATGLNIFVAIDETIPSSKTNKAFLLELVKDVVDNSEHLKPTSGSTDYEQSYISCLKQILCWLHGSAFSFRIFLSPPL